MCGIILTNKKIEEKELDYINYYSKFRGPDNTKRVNVDEFTLIHNHLHLTGKNIQQPFVNNGIYCIYNGQIYNYKDFGDYDSDGLCIIDLYKKYGEDFVNHLDGEFAISILDMIKNKIIVSTDIFATKPLWMCIENNEIGIASYKSNLSRMGFKNPTQITSNKLITIDLDDLKNFKTKEYYTFDLNQHKDTYDDWNKAFEKAVLKRTLNTDSKIVVGLSSGHDSGAICCALDNLKKKYKGVSVMSGENLKIISERMERNNNSEFVKVFEERFSEVGKEINENCEYIPYIHKYNTQHSSYKNYTTEIQYKDGRDDPGALGIAGTLKLLRIDKKDNDYKINLSGIGGDEHYNTMNGGQYGNGWNPAVFYENLESMFPWRNFNEGCLRNYLNMNEYIGGMYGFESRYPFLDKDVVQEFLWLTANLKNKYKYKPPIHYYLLENKYPTNMGEKHAFDTDVVQLYLYEGSIKDKKIKIDKVNNGNICEFRWKCINDICEHPRDEIITINFSENSINRKCSNLYNNPIILNYLKNGICSFIIWEDNDNVILTPTSFSKKIKPEIDTDLQTKFIIKKFKNNVFGKMDGTNGLFCYVISLLKNYKNILKTRFDSLGDFFGIPTEKLDFRIEGM